MFGLLLGLPVFAQDPLVDRLPTELPAELPLEQCVALALEHSPILQGSRAGVDEALADRLIARARLFPQLGLSGSLVRLDPQRLSPAGALIQPGPTLFASEAFAGVVARQSVFDASTPASLRAAAIGVQAEDLTVAGAVAETRFAVTVAYVRLAAAGELVGVARVGLERQIAFEDLVTALFEAGKSSRLDVLKAASQRTDAEAALVAATETEALAQVVLSQVMGDDRPIRTVAGPFHEIEPAPAEDAVLERARQDNPALQHLAARARQAQASTNSVRGQRLPELSVAASYGYRYRDEGGGADEYMVGTFVDWPLFSGGAIHGQVERMRARQAGVDAAVRALEDQLQVDVREALMRWRVSAATVAFATRSVEVNREALQAATVQFASGQATALEVLTSQADLARAEASLIGALGDHAVSRAMVARVTGTSTPGSEGQR